MNSPEPARDFEITRRQHLIDATIEALADVGFKAASLSQIARRADVSTGLFAHYFGDKDGLLEATLRFMATRLVRATRQRLRAATTARERLYAVPDSALADQEFERRTSAVWLAFWGQITHSTRYQRIQLIYQRRMLSNLRHDLRALVPPDCVEIYATMIATMIDGVWLRSHASAKQANGAHARSIVRALIDGLITGVHDATPADAFKTTTPTPPHVKAKTKSTSLPLSIRPPRPASRPRLIKLVSPVSNEVLGAFAAARDLEIETAMERARSGLAAWQHITGAERETRLKRCADAIWANAEELAFLTAMSTGRPIAQTMQIGLPLAAQAFARVSGLASRPISERVEFGAGIFGYTRHEPVGIIAGHGHWSAPLLDPCRQAAPALAFGNAIIFQTSPQGAPTALRLGKLLEQVGLPAGVFTVLTGDAETTRLILNHTDDLGPARDIWPKSATIIFADADMEEAATAVLHGGRRWTPTPDFSENRVFVQRRGLVRFRTRLSALVKEIPMGDPRDPAMSIGALVSDAHLRHVLSLIDHAIKEGATCILGGRGCGSFLTPTILDGCKDDMPIVRESVFAPVITLLVFEDDEEIVRLIGRQEPSAPAAIFCADVGHGHRIANRLSAIFCCINDSALAVTNDVHCGFDPSSDGDWPSGRYTRSKRLFCRDRRCSGV